MKTIISYIPRREGNAHIFLPLLLFSAGLSSILASVQLYKIRLPLQIICLIFVSTGIELVARFSLCFFEYSVIEGDDGEYLLRIKKLQGKYSRLVCEARISDILSFSEAAKPDFSAYGKSIPSYSYTVNISPQKSLSLLLKLRSENPVTLVGIERSRSDYAVIRLEYGGEFVKELNLLSRAEKAAEYSGSEATEPE